MKFCTSCGAGNADSRTSCSECGASLPADINSVTPATTTKVKQKNKNKGKQGLVLAALVGIASVIALAVLFSGSPVSKALTRTTDSLASIAQEQTMLQKFLKCGEKLTGLGKYSMTLDLYSDSYCVGVETDYSKSAKILSGEFNYSDSIKNLELEMLFSADKKDLQVAVPQVSSNIYGAPLKDMRKKYEESILASVLPLSLPKNMDWNLFSAKSAEDVLKQLFGEKFDAFKKTVEVEKMGIRSLNVNGTSMECKAYRITWSSKALGNLIGTSDGTDFMKHLGDLLDEILPEVEPDCIVYVNKDGCAIGIDYVSMGAQCLFILEGEENLWEKFSLTVKSVYGDTVVYNGGIRQIGSVMHIYLENQNERLFSFRFDDASGEFSLETRSAGDLLSGRLFSEDSTMEMEISWYLTGSDKHTIAWSMSSLKQDPQKLAKAYINLLDMSLTDWQRMLIDLGVRIP